MSRGEIDAPFMQPSLVSRWCMRHWDKKNSLLSLNLLIDSDSHDSGLASPSFQLHPWISVAAPIGVIF